MGGKLSKAIERSKYTGELDISYQEINAIPGNVLSLKNITLLNAAGNKLKVLDTLRFDRLQTLETVDLAGNQLTRFPQHILKLKHLKTLNIGFNKISDVPNEICLLKTLQKLDISGNGLKYLPDTLGDLSELKELRVDKNNLTDLPQSLARLKLSVITMKGNQFTTIPSVLPKIEGPEEISLSDGEIKELSVEIVLAFSKTKTLKVLDLSKNRIKKVPPELTELFILREINLMYNPIKDWPERVRAMMNLTFNFEDAMKAELWTH